MVFKTRQQIAQELGISRKTLKRWLDAQNVEIRSGLIPVETADRILDILRKDEMIKRIHSDEKD